MEATIRHLGGVAFEITASGHRIVSDQTSSNGGGDSGMTPPELLLASLGACAGYYAAEYLRVRFLTTPRLVIRVSAEKALQPTRLSSFRIEVDAPGLDKRHEAGIFRAVRTCLIHNTLLHPPKIELVVNAELDLTAPAPEAA